MHRSFRLLIVVALAAGLVGVLPGTAWAPRNLARSLATIEDVPCSTGANGSGNFDGSIFMDGFVERSGLVFVDAYLTGTCTTTTTAVDVSDRNFLSPVTIDPASSCDGLLLVVGDAGVPGTVADGDPSRPVPQDTVTVMLSQTDVTLEGEKGAARALVCRIARHHERWDSIRLSDELDKLVNGPTRKGGR